MHVAANLRMSRNEHSWLFVQPCSQRQIERKQEKIENLSFHWPQKISFSGEIPIPPRRVSHIRPHDNASAIVSFAIPSTFSFFGSLAHHCEGTEGKSECSFDSLPTLQPVKSARERVSSCRLF